MKPHVASLQHFLKFKQYYKHNHYLNNQVTADLKKRNENEYDTLKKRLLKNKMYVQTPAKMCFENKRTTVQDLDREAWRDDVGSIASQVKTVKSPSDVFTYFIYTREPPSMEAFFTF